MTDIKIFTDDTKIDLEKFINTRGLVCANSGGGKSYAIRKQLEESHGHVMSIILDVEGEFKTLREKYDYLLIGEGGDVELNMKSAKLLPKKLLELNISAIIDISELKRNERIQYAKRFLDALMDCPRKYWKPCLVVLDEAHILAGQREMQPSCASVIDLMTRGRKRGFCGILCTQRISKLHKDAVAECNNVMIGRTGLDIDMKRAADILGFNSKSDMLSLRDLDEGEFFIFGPAISKSVKKVKVEKVKTVHPKVGMNLKEITSAPTEKVKSILSKLKELPKDAEHELKTTADLKKKVQELTYELRKQSNTKSVELSLKIAKNEGYNEGLAKGMNSSVTESKDANSLRASMQKIFTIAKNYDYKNSVDLTAKVFIPKTTPGEITLGLCAKKIYTFLYNNPHKSFSKVQIGMITGYSQKSGSFSNALSNLNSNGLISRDNRLIKIEKAESKYVLDDNQKLSIEFWNRKLGKCPGTIFKLLLDNPDKEYTKDEIGEITDYSPMSGSFSNAISKLNALEIIKRENGLIKINPEIMEL